MQTHESIQTVILYSSKRLIPEENKSASNLIPASIRPYQSVLLACGQTPLVIQMPLCLSTEDGDTIKGPGWETKLSARN